MEKEIKKQLQSIARLLRNINKTLAMLMQGVYFLLNPSGDGNLDGEIPQPHKRFEKKISREYIG